MRRLVMMTLVVFALVLGSAQLFTPAAQASSAPKAGGGSCPKGTVACYNCNGTFAFCARSHAYCPECPAP